MAALSGQALKHYRVLEAIGSGGMGVVYRATFYATYATPTGRLMAVAVRAAGDRPQVSLPVELFEVCGVRPTGEFDEYAACRDGQRFLAKLPVEQASKLKLHVVTNWTSLLSTEKPPVP